MGREVDSGVGGRPHSDTLRVKRDNDRAAGTYAAGNSTSREPLHPLAYPRASTEPLRPIKLWLGPSLLGRCPEYTVTRHGIRIKIHILFIPSHLSLLPISYFSVSHTELILGPHT